MLHPKVQAAAVKVLTKAEVPTMRQRGRLIEQAFAVCEVNDGAATISPAAVSKALTGITHVLVGGFAMPVHTKKPRATMDVDMVVGDVAKAEAAIAKSFPTLTMKENPGEDVTRYLDRNGQEVINLLHPVGRFKIPLTLFVMAAVNGRAMKVVSFEAMLVSKFLSMNSPHRLEDKQKQDDADLSSLFAANPGYKNWEKVERVFRMLGGDPLAGRIQTGELRRMHAKSIAARSKAEKRITEARARGERIVSG